MLLVMNKYFHSNQCPITLIIFQLTLSPIVLPQPIPDYSKSISPSSSSILTSTQDPTIHCLPLHVEDHLEHTSHLVICMIIIAIWLLLMLALLHPQFFLLVLNQVSNILSLHFFLILSCLHLKSICLSYFFDLWTLVLSPSCKISPLEDCYGKWKLENNNTWTLTTLPPDKHPIGCIGCKRSNIGLMVLLKDIRSGW